MGGNALPYLLDSPPVGKDDAVGHGEIPAVRERPARHVEVSSERSISALHQEFGPRAGARAGLPIACIPDEPRPDIVRPPVRRLYP